MFVIIGKIQTLADILKQSRFQSKVSKNFELNLNCDFEKNIRNISNFVQSFGNLDLGRNF